MFHIILLKYGSVSGPCLSRSLPQASLTENGWKK